MTETTEPLTNELQPGTVINGYRIERELGRGAMAIVYLAMQLDLGRPVAFKVLSAELAADADFVSRFFNEARAAAALSHPNIIQAFDAGQTSEGLYYFCMEYVEGETLLDIIKRDGRIPAARVLGWFLQIADALNYGWELHKFTHGDIKPENIMINRQGQAKLADFGLARVDGHEYAGSVVMLTPLYAPPELIRGERFVDECRPDIYAFGASLYHALAGTPPFPGTDAQVVIQRQLNEQLEPLNHRCLSLSKSLSDFVGSMLEKEMAKRLGNWKKVMDGLKRAQNEGASKKAVLISKETNARMKNMPPMPSAPKKQSNSMLVITMVVLAFCLLAILLGVLLKKPASAPHPQTPAVPAVEEAAAKTKPKETATGKTSDGNIPTGGESVESAARKIKGQLSNMGEDEEDADDASLPSPAVKAKPEAEEPEEPAQESEEPEPEQAEAKPKLVLIDPADYVVPFGLDDSQNAFEASLTLAFAWMDVSAVTPWLECFGGKNTVSAHLKSCRDKLAKIRENAPQDSVEETNIDFLTNTMFTGFEALPDAVRRNKAKVTAMTFDLGKETWRIIDFGTLQLCKARVEVQSPGRRNQVTYPWRTLCEKGILVKMCHSQALDSDSLEKATPYLACLALLGQTRFLESSLAKFKDEAGAKAWSFLLDYERLRQNQKNERAAYDAWMHLCSAARGGGRTTVSELCRELSGKYERTNVYRVFKPVIESMSERCRDYGLDEQLDKKLAETETARGDASLEPGRRMAALLSMNARFGQGRRENADRKYEKNLSALLQEMTQDTKNYGLGYAMPLLLADSVSNIHVMSARTRKLVDDKEDGKDGNSKYNQGFCKVLACLSRLEIGDWKYAEANKRDLQWKELEKQDITGHSKGSSSLLYCASLYARILLQQRFDGDYGKADRMLASALSDCQECDARTRGTMAAMALEYWLLGHRGSGGGILPAYLENGRAFVAFMRELSDENNWYAAHRRRLTFLFLANALEGGRLDDANMVIRKIQDKDISVACGFPDGSEYLQRGITSIATLLASEEDRKAPKKNLGLFDGSMAAEWLLLRMCALGETPLDDAADGTIRREIDKYAHAARLIEGEALMDWLMRRMAFELSRNNLKGAVDLTDYVLSLNASCLFPQVVRLLSLRGGLLQLAGIYGPIMDASLQLEKATCVSDDERKMLRTFAVYPRQADWKPGESEQNAGYFSYRWLCVTSELGKDGKEASSLEPLLKNRNNLSLAERTLLLALVDYLKTVRGLQADSLDMTANEPASKTIGEAEAASEDDAEMSDADSDEEKKQARKNRRKRRKKGGN